MGDTCTDGSCNKDHNAAECADKAKSCDSAECKDGTCETK